MQTSTSHQRRFCALEYRPGAQWSTPPSAESVILLVVEDDEAGLRFLLHPHLQSLILAQDRDYISALLKDFSERAKLHPEDLFQQLCTLSVGPLITYAIGSQLSDFPQLLELCATFIPA